MPEPDPTGLTLPTPEEQELELAKKQVREEVEARNHRPITTNDLRAMAKFCEDMNAVFAQILTQLQNEFKKGMLTFAQLADFLEKDAQQTEKRTKVENVFDSDEPTDTGPIVTHD